MFGNFVILIGDGWKCFGFMNEKGEVCFENIGLNS